MKLSSILLVACAGCSAASNVTAPTPASVTVTPAVMPEVVAPTSELAPSIYDLELKLRDSGGREIGLDVARGQPTLIAMFYASCPVACPVLISEVADTIAAVPASKQSELRILLVSFDPARDTPRKLGELVADRHLDRRWTVAVATEPDARTLAGVLGVKYRRLDNGEFFHGSTIVLLDGEGHPVARADSLGHRDALLAALMKP
jgi:protein SCO1/2